MFLDTKTFQTAATAAAERIRKALPGDFRPPFFLHFGAEYPLQGLLDEVLLDAPLAEFAPELPAGPNLDGESPRVLAGHCDGVPVLASVGNRRVAEGHGVPSALFPIALAWALDARRHLFLDTALSLVSEFKAGKWGMLADFVNDFGFSPLEGLHGMFSDPYPDLSETLDQVQNSEIINALAQFGDSPKLCTYHGVPGFHLPTAAEARRVRDGGADFLGHDLVLHLIFSHALGCKVSALVLAGAQLLPGSASHFSRREMLETGVFCAKQLRQGLRKALREMQDSLQGYGVSLLPETDTDELLRASIQKCATRTSPLKAFLKRPK